MKEIQLQKQHQNEKAIEAVRQIVESEEFKRVQNGERNDALVAGLQQLLVTNFDYDLGKSGRFKNGVDGDYGELTTQAVKQFKTVYMSTQENTKTFSEALMEGAKTLEKVFEDAFSDSELDKEELDKMRQATKNFSDELSKYRHNSELLKEIDLAIRELTWATREKGSINIDDSLFTKEIKSFKNSINPQNFER